MFMLIAMVCYLVIGVFPGSGRGYAEVIDKLAALLDDELILLSEIREDTEKPVARILANLDNSSNIDQDSLDYVIERRLLLREIQYLAIPKEKDVVMSLATQYIMNRYHKQNTQNFEQQLKAQGITPAELEDELMLYIKGMDYIRRKYRFNAFNTDISDPVVVLNLFQEWLETLKAKASIQVL